jgi:hypothetical protein
MQNAEVYIHLAEIAGVFVAFGALIAVRGGGARGPLEVGFTRGMVSFGVLVMVAGLAPVGLDLLGLAEHQVWAVSSALVIAGFIQTFRANLKTPETQANYQQTFEKERAMSLAHRIADDLVGVAYMLAVLLPPIIILLGVAPDLEAGLYFTTAVLLLMWAAWLLLDLVYAPRPHEDTETEDDLRETSARPPGSAT